MNKLKLLLFACILALTSYTHLYRIGHTFTFHNDEARDVLIVKKMVDTKTPVLLGPQTSVGNMYLGPLYYYFMLPSLVLSKMDPIGPAIMVALFGIMTTCGLYLYASKKFGIWAGVAAALFYAMSPVMLHYSRSSWNPNIVPFFALVLLIAWDLKSKLGWFLIGLCAGVIFQLHYVALVIVVLVALAKFYNYEKKTEVIFAVIGFLLMSAPFWLFELRHNFVNMQAFFTFLREGSQNADINSTYFSRLKSNLGLNISGIIGSKSIMLTDIPLALISIFSVLLYVVLPFVSGGLPLWYLLVASTLIVSVLKTPLHVHYVAYLFPVVSLAIAYLIANGHKLIKVITLISVAYLVWFSIPTLKYNLLTKDSIQIERSKSTADYIVKNANGLAYNVVSTPGTYATPVEYYLSLSQNPPKNTLQKLVFDICESSPCPENDTTTILFFGKGSTHPAITEYLGHPALNEFNKTRTIQKNEHVSYDLWVATMTIND